MEIKYDQYNNIEHEIIYSVMPRVREMLLEFEGFEKGFVRSKVRDHVGFNTICKVESGWDIKGAIIDHLIEICQATVK